MNILDRSEFAVQAAIIRDFVKYEGATLIVCDERGAVAFRDGLYKCVFVDVDTFIEYAEKFDIRGHVCLTGAPLDLPEILGVESDACKSFAYLEPMPPAVGDLVVRRLAPTLAAFVHDTYHNPGGADVSHFEEIMRTKGIFGAFMGTSLAGFVGRHSDGSMGMLEILPEFRRRGIGLKLSRFIINYVMTFGRVPFCDVFLWNDASLSLQTKLNMTEGKGYTFWFKYNK